MLFRRYKKFSRKLRVGVGRPDFFSNFFIENSVKNSSLLIPFIRESWAVLESEIFFHP
jgi:hypothetical protein